ncbi:hypothetical protein Tco_0368258 [Tanacetum coccineum]
MIHEDGDNDAIWWNDDKAGYVGKTIRFESSSRTKKYRGSNSNDGDNIRDGVKIAGEVIGSGDEIGDSLAENALYSSNKD